MPMILLQIDDPTATFSPAQLSNTVEAVTARPITGLWISETRDNLLQRDILSITSTSLCWVKMEVTPGNDQPPMMREQFAEIISLDAQAGRLVYRICWMRVNGQYVRFDSQNWYASFTLDGNVLRLAQSPSGFPWRTGEKTYIRH